MKRGPSGYSEWSMVVIALVLVIALIWGWNLTG